MLEAVQNEVIESFTLINSSTADVSFCTSELLFEYLNSVDSRNLKIFSTGVGASGVPAKVLSHALSSMGISGSDADPTELLHGGFGRIKTGDLLICFTDSGETKEILRILRHAKKLNIYTILVTQNTLLLNRELSDHVICYSLGDSGEIVSGVPSTSLIAQTMISLGICKFLSRKSILQLDASTHPLGNLGLQHSKVRDVMREVQANLVGECEITVEQALNLMNDNKMGVLFFNSSEKGLGIFTDGDLRRALVNSSNATDVFLEKIMEDLINFSPKYLSPEDTLKSANEFFESGKKILVAPVLNDGNLVGVLHVHDLLEAIG